MARKYRNQSSTGFSVLLVDDDADYASATRVLLEREGHEVIVACSGAEALDATAQREFDLMLLDYFMPHMTGEEVVREVRKLSPRLQIVLQTGYANERPPRELLLSLDIQGYFDKSEGPEKLLLWTDVGLKAAASLRRIERSRTTMQNILELTPLLHRVQPVRDLATVIVQQLSRLFAIDDVALAMISDGDAMTPLRVDARELALLLEPVCGTGRFAADPSLQPELAALALRSFRSGLLANVQDGVLVPLKVGALCAGVIYAARVLPEEDLELLRVFANQATLAIHNMQLYEIAALDPLTGVHARRFFEQWIRRELRTALRTQQPISLMMLDIDDFKHVNDTHGHLVGDQVLGTLGRVLRQAMRENDVVGRFGGDEFGVVLPQTTSEGAEQVASRIQDALRASKDQELGFRVSIGIVTLEPHSFNSNDFSLPVLPAYFQGVGRRMIDAADRALYAAKSAGKDRQCTSQPITWDPLTSHT